MSKRASQVSATSEVTVRNDRVVRVDTLVAERPLQVVLNGRRYAVLMRTPNTSEHADIDLTLGFLLSEGILEDWDDISAINHCTDPQNRHRTDTLIVHLQPGCLPTSEPVGRERASLINSACGVCGTIDLERLLPKIPDRVITQKPDLNLVHGLPQRLKSLQTLFAVTGGIHGAALFSADGQLLSMNEDVGRHNALDKVIGTCIREQYEGLAGALAVVSGRIGFELVQKALLSGIGTLVGVGAASDLAHEMSKAHGLHLFSFTKPTSANYHPPGENSE